ncbi:hypothetical protein [Cytobacillus firmus]|uniref:hypothetical protein n=1 Tax=Cytobacillus firmus TaxID=1399 RepID=UPI001C8E39F0|nr:hypothetical protein [Cytobacillus firmus]MBX9974712.1 hypothetical protein [Cytobacillus firmus]
MADTSLKEYSNFPHGFTTTLVTDIEWVIRFGKRKTAINKWPAFIRGNFLYAYGDILTEKRKIKLTLRYVSFITVYSF